MKQNQYFDKGDSLKKTKDEFNSLLNRPETIWILKSNLILIGVSWIFFGVFFQFLPPQIPIFFSNPWGLNQLADKIYFVLLPACITLLFFINIRLASLAIKKEILLTSIILWTQLLVSLLATIAVIRIVLLLA